MPNELMTTPANPDLHPAVYHSERDAMRRNTDLVIRSVALHQPDRYLRNVWRGALRRVRRRTDANILGICSTGHGASLALVSSRFGVRALSLERFLGKKNALYLAREEYREIRESLDPIPSGIRFCLRDRFGRLPPIAVFEDSWEPLFKALVHGLPLRPRDIDFVMGSESHFAINRSWQGRALSHYFPNAVVRTDLEHHAVHRYQAFLASGFGDAAVFTADASGEPLRRKGGKRIAMTFSSARDKEISVFAEHTSPESSPGRLYNNFNMFLGFEQGEEGKTMGLSSYGRDTCYRYLRPQLELFDDGSFFFPDDAALKTTLREHGIFPRLPGMPILPDHEDVAQAAQLLLDDIMHNALRALESEAPSERLCLAGGIALNSVTNERIFRASRFREIYIMPNAGDLGQALGCALFAERMLLNCPARAIGESDGLGPRYAEADVLAAIENAGLQYSRLADPVNRAAALIAEGRIVGWFQGGSEYGPRSLGHRSILADCRKPEMKDHLNDRVKHREPFRPYAPAVLEERVSEYFDLHQPSPFMLRVVDVLPHQRAVIPSVTHVDGTARVQTVSAAGTPLFHQLIAAFDALTGVPVVLNTSFNVAGRPIVETPADAIECFLSTNIDALILHNYLLEKSPV
jgi:carbamoyltransferase